VLFAFTEVKFQLTRDTLEHMMRSMMYINDRLNVVRHSFIFIIVVYDDESED